MGKDLRTSAVQLKLQKYPKMDLSEWGIQHAQPFLPPYEKLFKTETVTSLPDYGVRVSEGIESIQADTIKTTKGQVIPIHRKTTTILSPFKWMRGDYGVLNLPKSEEIAREIHAAIQSPHTAAYVGALSSLLLSESGCIHFPKVYGVYSGVCPDYTFDISDDYEDLSERRWFTEHIGKTFDLKMRTPMDSPPKLHLGEDMELEIADEIHADHVSNPSSGSHVSTDIFSEDSDESEDVFDIHSCACSDDSGEEEDGDEEEEPFAWATLHNVPVVTTVMEKCEGTYYDLIRAHSEPEKHIAWISQIVFALAYAQRTFGFVHNDLHGNNVMYVKTTQEFQYYKHNGVCYKVPTYGYIMKIIDFDRAIVSARLLSMKDPRTFVSSQFQPDEQAAGQYNMEPFFLHEFPHIPASSSFDLCRFATSIFWDMFPEGPDKSSGPLLPILLQWMSQSDGSSVMFRKQRDNHDRYHGFHLYKAIARYCKDAVPRREIQKLSIYHTPSIPVGIPYLSIES